MPASRILAMRLLVLMTALVAGGGALWGAAASEEVARIRSPDGVVEAILTRSDYGATVDYVYKLYVAPAGTAKIPEEPVLVADHVAEPRVEWPMPRFLRFSYREARIFNFTNFWQSRDVQNFLYIVEIRLDPATGSYSLGQ